VNPLDDLRKEAKHWLKEVRRDNPGPQKRLRLSYPNAPANPGLRDVQHALARERGYQSWKALTAAVSRRQSDDASGALDTDAARVAHFLEFACWDHTVHGRGSYAMTESAALRIVQKHPEIARNGLSAAVVCGELAAVERILAKQPELATQPGGSRRWEPLLYLCYGRVALDAVRDKAVAIARLLLDRGANPNAYYPAGDAIYSTLVGIAGEGEQDASPHPMREPLYQLLIERGAELYDIQVLYNTHFHGDVLWWLELTHAHAARTGRLKDWANPDWPMFSMGGYGSGARFLLSIAIHKNDVALADWLLTHGANPDAAPARDERLSKRSLYEDAVVAGREEIAALLRRHGATPRVPLLADEEAFIAACLRLDRAAAKAALDGHPEYLMSPKAMFAAAARDRADVVALLIDLGTSVDIQDAHRQRALHVAAAHDARAVAALLIRRGAEVDARETQWKAVPIGYAARHGHQQMVDLLSGVSRDVWNLTYHGKVARLTEVLATEPERAREVTPNGITPLWWLPNDEGLAVRVAEVLLAHGTDPKARSREGKTASDHARERGLDEAADRLAAAASIPSGPAG